MTDERERAAIEAAVECSESRQLDQVQGFRYRNSSVIRDCLRVPSEQVLWEKDGPEDVVHPEMMRRIETICMERIIFAYLAAGGGREGRVAAWRLGRERAAREHESISPASDEERLQGSPGAGAMGAIVEYRDAIRSLRDPTPEELP